MRLRWSGNREAQRQADEAFGKFLFKRRKKFEWAKTKAERAAKQAASKAAATAEPEATPDVAVERNAQSHAV